MMKPLALLDEVEADAIKLERAHKLFDLRRRGLSKYECSRELGMTMAALNTLEAETRDRVFSSISASIQDDRCLRISQLDSVIHKATLISEATWEYDVKLSALTLIVKSIQAAARITGLEMTGSSITTNNSVTITNPNVMELLARYREIRNEEQEEADPIEQSSGGPEQG
jgi:hypothetical protein